MRRHGFMIVIALFFFVVAPASAQDRLHVAVAANFISPFQELSRIFEARTGIPVEATYASTGQLYTQIVNGAPYDLFLSADREKPTLLHRAGRSDAPFVYATGRVIFWTAKKNLCSAGSWREITAMPSLHKIAIANPVTAPYGAAAKEALEKTGLLEKIQGKLVFSQSIAQAFQYAATGAVDAGFCALSAGMTEEGRRGCFFTVDEAPQIVQSACLLKRSSHQKAAAAFAKFLFSPEATDIKKKYGYR